MSIFLLLGGVATTLSAQVPSCSASGVAAAVHAEGIAEKLGDFTMSCSGGATGVTANLNVFIGLNANLTNSTGTSGTGITATINNGGGTVPASANIQVSGAQAISVLGLNYQIPASGTTTITISGIRAAINTIPTSDPAVLATFGGTGFNVISSPLIPLSATPTPTLLSSLNNNGFACAGQPLPAAPIDLSGLIASGTCASTLRVTEANFDSFARKDPSASNGMRLVVSLSGYGTSTRLFVPDVLVGNTGTNATSANAFGAVSQLGIYTPGTATGQLLLARVNGADANGAGGTPVISVPTAATTFPAATELSLSNGAATVTYEVLDSSANNRESVQIPVYVSLTGSANTGTVPSLGVRLGPVSTVFTADATSPIPRFVSTTPGSDCTVLSDCSAPYFPSLTVDTTPVTISALALGPPQVAFIRVGNGGAGVLSFTTSVTYPAGAASGWLKVTPPSGVNNVTLMATADPTGLNQGTYNASIVISAGQYGSQTIPVTFTVGAPGVTVQSIVSAASFTQGGPLTAGAIAALFGLNLNGKNVSVSFDGLPSQVFGVYNVNGGSQQQINLLVPTGLAGRTSANVVVTVDNQQSNRYAVSLVQNSPGIFNPGILNQDLSVNTSANGALQGDVIAIYMTGLTVPLTGQVTVKIGGVDLLVPQYAGEAPTLTGLEQVNVMIPKFTGTVANTLPVVVCIPALDPTQRVCSPPVNLYLR